MSLDDAADRTISLVSKRDTGAEFKLPASYLRISSLVRNTLDTDPTATQIQLDMSKDVLAAIVDYLNHYKGKEPQIVERPLKSRNMADVVADPFDATFIDKVAETNLQNLYDLIMGALLMDIRGLIHLGCAKVASLIKGLPLDKIKPALAVAPSKA